MRLDMIWALSTLQVVGFGVMMTAPVWAATPDDEGEGPGGPVLPDEGPGGPVIPEEERILEEEPYRNPTGRWALGGTLGLSSGTGGTLFIVGANVGYAVFTGILPGVRGLAIIGGDFGGELTGTLTLTPPVKWPFTPFVIGEGGRRWLGGVSGWLYGVGGGVYLGSARQTVNVQVGYVFRYWVQDNGPTIRFGLPILGATLSF